MTTAGPNPSGLCMCGCGQKTLIAKRTRLGDNSQPIAIKGTPNCFIAGHFARLPRTAPGRQAQRREYKPLPDVRKLLEEWEHFGDVLGRTPTEFCKVMGGHSVDSVRTALVRTCPNDPRTRSFIAGIEREIAHRAALNGVATRSPGTAVA